MCGLRGTLLCSGTIPLSCCCGAIDDGATRRLLLLGDAVALRLTTMREGFMDDDRCGDSSPIASVLAAAAAFSSLSLPGPEDDDE